MIMATWSILVVYLIYFNVSIRRDPQVKIAAFTESFIAINVIQYLHSNMVRQPERHHEWILLISHLRSFANHRPPTQKRILYRNLRVSLHVHDSLPLSSAVHAMIDELLDFAEREATLHGVTDLSIVDAVKLCKKITGHPLLA